MKLMQLKYWNILRVGRVKKIKIGNAEITGTDVRSIFGLKSAKFGVSMEGDIIKFTVTRIWARSWLKPVR